LPRNCSEREKRYMRLACEAAFGAIGRTSPNPPVGALLVRGDAIVSTGATMACGLDHAEICAIRQADARDLNGAEMFVTLEPCCHHGKTPPCVDAIIEAGIARVYLPLCDPNPRVAGKGVAALRAAGVDVVMMPEFAPAAFDLIRPFAKYIQTGRAHVMHKSAMTLDGRTATHSGNSQWISSEHSRFIVHLLRGMVDAIVIGCGTLVADNPTLNARPDSFSREIAAYFSSGSHRRSGRDDVVLDMTLSARGSRERRSPLRIIVGLPERIDPAFNIFFDDRFLFYAEPHDLARVSSRSDTEIVRKLADAGRIVTMRGETTAERARFITTDLAARGIIYAMLEGGARTAGAFFDAGEIDEFLYIVAPKVLGDGLPTIAGTGPNAIAEALALHEVSCVFAGGDVVYHAYREPFRGGE